LPIGGMMGKPPPKVAPPPPKKFVSSLGDRMRRETGEALERSLKHGSLAALQRYGLKVADMGGTSAMADLSHMLHTQAPTTGTSWADFRRGAAMHATPPGAWDDFRRGAAAHVAQQANPSAMAMSPRAAKNAPLAPHLGAPQSAAHAPMPAPAPTPVPARAAAPAAAAGASRFKLPSLGGVKGTLGLAGLAALGAGAYGLHKQHQDDLEGERLTYAPMQGGFY